MSGLRIVGGQWRGTPLEAPSGREITRPTTDRTREQIASMVLSSCALDLTGISVCDMFAGSGALGLEMLSRGAARCLFLESDRRVAACVRRNCERVHAGDRAHIQIGDSFRLVSSGSLWGAPFSLLLLDPPYALPAERVTGLFAAMVRRGAVSPQARVVYEHASSADGLAYEGLPIIKSKTHGATCIDLMVFEG